MLLSSCCCIHEDQEGQKVYSLRDPASPEHPLKRKVFTTAVSSQCHALQNEWLPFREGQPCGIFTVDLQPSLKVSQLSLNEALRSLIGFFPLNSIALCLPNSIISLDFQRRRRSLEEAITHGRRITNTVFQSRSFSGSCFRKALWSLLGSSTLIFSGVLLQVFGDASWLTSSSSLGHEVDSWRRMYSSFWLKLKFVTRLFHHVLSRNLLWLSLLSSFQMLSEWETFYLKSVCEEIYLTKRHWEWYIYKIDEERKQHATWKDRMKTD